jgi:hypothetical protein
MNYKFLIPLLFSLLLFVPIAYAEKGVGIMWSTQSEMVKEGQSNCVNYQVYNPFSEDATIYMTATGDLQALVVDSQPVLVPAGTTHDKGIPVSLCFNIPKVYTQSCTAGIVCEQSCTGQEVNYTGEVIAAEKSQVTTGAEAAGSSTKAVASAPLVLKVTCEPKQKNWMPILVIAIVLILAFAFLKTKKRKR